MRLSVICCGIFCLSVSAHCIVVEPVVAQSLRFRHLSINEGLSQNTVRSIVQDQQGYMWIGTVDGLNKYDGHTVTTYYNHRSDPTSLSDNEVLALLADRSGKLWVTTGRGGIDLYDPITDSFVRYRPNMRDSLGDINIKRGMALIEDKKGVIWVATQNGGLYALNPASRQVATYRHDPSEPNSLSSDHLYSVFEDADGVIWVGTYDAGLTSFDPETQTFTHYRHIPGVAESLGAGIVSSIYQDRSSTLWIGTSDGGLNRFDDTSETFTRYVYQLDNPTSLNHNRVEAIFEDQTGVFWVGTRWDGLTQFNRRTGQFNVYRHDPAQPAGLNENGILKIYEDRSGILWIGTDGGGVNIGPVRGEAFAHYHHSLTDDQTLSDNIVHAIYEDARGTLWVGTRQGGVNQFVSDTEGLLKRTRLYAHDPADPQSLSIGPSRSIYQDREGVMWIGTLVGGLSQMSPNAASFSNYRHDPANPLSLSSNNIRVILEDQRGTMWIATEDNGLNRMDRNTGAFYHYTHDPHQPGSISGNEIRALYEDRQGILWVGTRRSGLNRFDHATSTFASYQHDPTDSTSLSHMAVFGILEDVEGTLWVGTLGGGLNRLDRETDTFRVYTEADGLPNNTIYGILQDDQGYLWMSTNKGLSRFDPQTESFTNYDTSDGLQGNEFNGGAYYKGRDGTLYFGGLHGFNRVFPDRLRTNEHVPPVVLTSFAKHTDGQVLSIPPAAISTIELAYDDLLLEFTFAALDYQHPESNRYAYWVEGLNEGWIDLGTKHELVFPNLPQGTYTLHIKGSNNDEVWNESGLSIPIVVTPPFWETSWFRVLTLIGIGGVLWGGYLIRTYSIRASNKRLQAEVHERKQAEAHRSELLEKQEQLLDEMAQKNIVLAEQNAELERFTYTVSHDLKTPLVTIKGFLGLLKKDLGEQISTQATEDMQHIATAANRMGRLLEDLLELSRVGRLMGPQEPISLTELAYEIVSALEGQRAENQATWTIASEMPTIYGDRMRIGEVLQNLIENAFKFKQDDIPPHVQIGATQDNDMVTCYVKDNGIGIPKVYHEKIFDLFERLDQRLEGTGIGLALVKRIVEVHGGEVGVTSAGTDQGSTFYFTLPIFIAPTPDA